MRKNYKIEVISLLLIVIFNIIAVAFSYGQVIARVDTLSCRLERIEKLLDNKVMIYGKISD